MRYNRWIFRPTRTVLPILTRQNRFGHANSLEGFGHVMGADNMRAPFYAQNRAGQRRWQAFIHSRAE
jgi:hypothetical protein